MRSEAVDDLLKSVDNRRSGEFPPQENQKNWDFTVKNRFLLGHFKGEKEMMFLTIWIFGCSNVLDKPQPFVEKKLWYLSSLPRFDFNTFVQNESSVAFNRNLC
jgi:hypothetical protein